MGLAGALGCVVGSVPAYYLGMYGGRPLIEQYGKYILVSRHDLDMADRWFERHGEATVFFARLLPVIRTFIAFPAGVARMDMKRFIAYTFAGSLPWCRITSYNVCYTKLLRLDEGVSVGGRAAERGSAPPCRILLLLRTSRQHGDGCRDGDDPGNLHSASLRRTILFPMTSTSTIRGGPGVSLPGYVTVV